MMLIVLHYKYYFNFFSNEVKAFPLDQSLLSSFEINRTEKRANSMLSAIMIFYEHQNLQYLAIAMFLLHALLHIEHFSRNFRLGIIKASIKLDKQEGKCKT